MAALISLGCVCAASAEPVSITLGQSVALLNGPWKFHTGDDPAWADPKFDDSGWEAVDLTAPAGARDQDVGLSRYVVGWGARGHRGYSGYAWYRLRVTVEAPSLAALALVGPTAVDSAYQIFCNGQLLGGDGAFSGNTPTVFSIRPQRFALPQSLTSGGEAVVAVRVWMGPWDLGDPDGGGMRIAPALGLAGSASELYAAQWQQTIAGYIVEVLEAAAFLLLAVMALTLGAVEHSLRSYYWLCAAMALTALVRANQAVFFWGQFETVHVAEVISVVLLPPLCLAAWTIGWRDWLGVRRAAWMPALVALLTALYIAMQFVRGSWFYGVFPHIVETMCASITTWTRLLFIVLTGIILYAAVKKPGSRRGLWLTFPVVLLISIGQFAREVSTLGVQGIWFPWGTGVSRTQFAYAAFDLVFFTLLLRRFWSATGPRVPATQI